MYNELFEFRQKWDGVWRRRYMNACIALAHTYLYYIRARPVHYSHALHRVFPILAFPAIYAAIHIFPYGAACGFNVLCGSGLILRAMDGAAAVCVCLCMCEDKNDNDADDIANATMLKWRVDIVAAAATITARAFWNCTDMRMALRDV